MGSVPLRDPRFLTQQIPALHCSRLWFTVVGDGAAWAVGTAGNPRAITTSTDRRIVLLHRHLDAAHLLAGDVGHHDLRFAGAHRVVTDDLDVVVVETLDAGLRLEDVALLAVGRAGLAGDVDRVVEARIGFERDEQHDRLAGLDVDLVGVRLLELDLADRRSWIDLDLDRPRADDGQLPLRREGHGDLAGALAARAVDADLLGVVGDALLEQALLLGVRRAGRDGGRAVFDHDIVTDGDLDLRG